MKKQVKGLAAAIIAGVIAFVGFNTAMAATTIVTVGQTSGDKGETVTVPITIANNSGVSNAIILLSYDSTQLTLPAVSDTNGMTDLATNTILLTNSTAAGYVGSTLITLSFAISSSASYGQKSIKCR